MGIEIRSLRSEERDGFLRFLERCYGHSHNFFPRVYPDLYNPGAQELDCFLVAAVDGEIVSHVGAFPMPVVAGPSRLLCAGIGGVATLPQARGKGYMSQLMRETRRRMRERGVCLAILWGDRQRYRHFGYETCGVKYELTLTARSLEHAGVHAVSMQEADPGDPDVIAAIKRLQGLRTLRVERPLLGLTLARAGVRAFLCEGGYLLARGEGRDLDVQEVVSASGDEPGMVLGALALSFGGRATLDVGPGMEGSEARLVAAAHSWRAVSQGMMSVIDWPLLASSLQPILEQNAAHAKPFSLAVGCETGEETDWATFHWDGASLDVSRGHSGALECRLEAGDLAAGLFGGPFAKGSLGPMAPLAPLPLHVPRLDHV